MVDLPLEGLLRIALDDLYRNQAQFARVANEIDLSTPTKALFNVTLPEPPGCTWA
jgi:hypothetical protein